MPKKKGKVSISLSKEVLDLVDQAAEDENRKRSNYIDTVLREHFGLAPLQRSSRPLARSVR